MTVSRARTAPSASLANGGCPIRTSKYETSSNCRSLSEIAKRYVAAGGLKQSAPCTADRIAEGAHAKAWMALAISKTGDPNSNDLVAALKEKAPAGFDAARG